MCWRWTRTRTSAQALPHLLRPQRGAGGRAATLVEASRQTPWRQSPSRTRLRRRPAWSPARGRPRRRTMSSCGDGVSRGAAMAHATDSPRGDAGPRRLAEDWKPEPTRRPVPLAPLARRPGRLARPPGRYQRRRSTGRRQPCYEPRVRRRRRVERPRKARNGCRLLLRLPLVLAPLPPRHSAAARHRPTRLADGLRAAAAGRLPP